MKNDFISICKKSQPALKKFLKKELEKYYSPDSIFSEPGFIYAKGNFPVLLTAHLDTVHHALPKEIVCEESLSGHTIISSPQGIGGDDRCGVFIIMETLRTSDYRPSILFCEDEEIGGVGSKQFTHSRFIHELSEMKFLIELDRAHDNDAVYYWDGNENFKKWIEKTIGYAEEFGTFSDISHLCPACGISGVNLSCGYYNAHTTKEYVILEQMQDTADQVVALLEKAASETVPQFHYKEEKISQFRYNYNYGYTVPAPRYSTLYIYFDENYTDCITIQCETELEGFGRFFKEHPDFCFNDIFDWCFY